MKLNILCLLLIVFSQVSAQKQSTWKIINANSVFDDGVFYGPEKLKARLNTNRINDVAIASDGVAYIATNQGLFSYLGDGKLSRIRAKDTPIPSAFALAFDSKDNLWIASAGKIIKYKDGNFETFAKKDTEGLEAGKVLEIVVDKEDKIWVTGHKNRTTPDGMGLSMFDGEKWTNYEDVFDKKFIEDLTIDANGNIWAIIGREDNAVGMFDGEKWTKYLTNGNNFNAKAIRALAADKNGKVYLGTDKGLSVFENNEWEDISLTQIFKSKFLTKLTAMSQPSIISLAVDNDNVLWIGTKEQGVFRINNSSKIEINKDNSPLPSNAVKRIIVDRNNAKWFITGYWYENMKDHLLNQMSTDDMSASFQGVVMFKETDYTEYPEWEVHSFYTEDMPKSTYNKALIDNDENIWLSTSRGVLKRTGEDVWEETYEGYNVDYTIAKDANGVVWYAGKTISKLEEGNVQNWEKKENGLGGIIKGASFDSKNRLWFGNNKGLCSFDGSDFNCIDKKQGLPDARFQDVMVDSKDNVWVAFYKGSAKFDGTNWTSYDKKNGGLLGIADCILERKNGDILIGTGKGVAVSTDQTNWVMNKCPKELYPYMRVNSLAEDAEGNIWVGSESTGVFVWKVDGTWIQFTSENSGLPQDAVEDIFVSKEGVWIVTSKEKKTLSSQMSSMGTSSSSSSTTVDPADAINKLIKAFDPQSAITLFKGKL